MRIGIAAAVAIFGCRSPDSPTCRDPVGTLHLAIDERAFSADDRAHLLSAIQRWNVFAGGPDVIAATFTAADGPCRIFREPLPSGMCGAHARTTGSIRLTPNCECVHTVAWPPEASCFESVAMHEMGHALGMAHLPDGQQGIMRAGLGAWDFTEADRLECLRIGLCSE